MVPKSSGVLTHHNLALISLYVVDIYHAGQAHIISSGAHHAADRTRGRRILNSI
jgi:hypothetical protein